MMRVNQGYWVLAALAVMVGLTACNGKNTAQNTDTTTTTGGTSNGTTTPEAPKIDDKLKHSGFRYFGLDRTGDATYEYSSVQGAAGTEGTEAIEVVSAAPEKSVIKINRGGSLTDLGAETYEVRPDGVYLVEMKLGVLDKPMLAMPADVKVGDKWVSELSAKASTGATYAFKISNHAEKEESVVTKAGEFTALLVTGTGTITIDGKSRNVQYKTWYAKDAGTVRMRIEAKNDQGETVKQSVELVKKAG